MHSRQWCQEVHKPNAWYCDMAHDGQSGFKYFGNAEAFHKHLESDHMNTIPAKKIASSIRRNVISRPRDVGVCPLCLEDISAFTQNITEPEKPEDFQGGTSLKSERQAFQRRKVQIQLPDTQLPSDEESDDGGISISAAEAQPKQQKARESNHLKLSKHIAQHLKSLAFLSLRWFEDGETSNDSDQDSSRIKSGWPSKQSGSSAGSLNFEDVLSGVRLEQRLRLHWDREDFSYRNLSSGLRNVSSERPRERAQKRPQG